MFLGKHLVVVKKKKERRRQEEYGEKLRHEDNAFATKLRKSTTYRGKQVKVLFASGRFGILLLEPHQTWAVL
jgi:hypothetical protein